MPGAAGGRQPSSCIGAVLCGTRQSGACGCSRSLRDGVVRHRTTGHKSDSERRFVVGVEPGRPAWLNPPREADMRKPSARDGHSSLGDRRGRTHPVSTNAR